MNSQKKNNFIQIFIYTMVFSYSVILFITINEPQTETKPLTVKPVIQPVQKKPEAVLGLTTEKKNENISLITSDIVITAFIKLQEEIKYVQSPEEIGILLNKSDFDDILENINSLEL